MVSNGLTASRAQYHPHELSTVSTALSVMATTLSLSDLISESFCLSLSLPKLTRECEDLTGLQSIDRLIVSTSSSQIGVKNLGYISEQVLTVVAHA